MDDAIAYEKEMAELQTEYNRKWAEAWAAELEDEDCPF